MGKRLKLIAAIAFILLVIGLSAYLLRDANFAVLQPRGEIGERERAILLFATALSLIVVIPVFALTFFITWKYRASNTRATYSPNWEHSRKFEAIWWAVPIILIVILSVVAWKSSHSLDPYKPIVSDKKPITIQVVALQWKWLFIYPEQNIASVNYVQFPVNMPVNFEVTSDAPMNSFWIPQLGGQIYAMSGMSTQLHLIANQSGDYKGVSANISGKGFSGMQFTAKATTDADFALWAQDLKQSANVLNHENYNTLSQLSQNNEVMFYSSVDTGLYDTIIMKYMDPMSAENSHNGMGH